MARNADSAALHGDLSSFPEFAGRHFQQNAKLWLALFWEMLMAKVFLQMALNKGVTLQETQKKDGMACAIVTDCRALYDLILKENVQSTVDKRVAIETMVIRDLIGQLCAQLRWVSSERQLADGLTKIASRQQFSEALREGWMQLVHDENLYSGEEENCKATRGISYLDNVPSGYGYSGCSDS